MGRISWGDLSTSARLRKLYVPAYVRCIQAKQIGGDAAIADMDAKLPEGTILLFRRMAHTQVETAKRHAATDAATAQGRSWYQWATGQQGQQRLPAGAAGGGRGAPGQPPSPTASSSSESGELSADEWARLQEMMQESEAVGL